MDHNGVESVWDVLTPDGDQPWGFLEELTDRPEPDRAAIIMDALKIFVDQDWADAEDAVIAAMAAFLVAVARSPRNLARQRDVVLRFTSTEFGVATVASLVGDLTALRTPEAAQLALGAADWVGRTCLRELHRVPAESERLSAALDELRAAIHASLRPWTAAADRPKRPRKPSTPWMVPGEILTIDLGDGFRTYAQLGQGFDVAVHDVHEPADAEVLPIDQVIGRPVLFNVWVNQFMPRPPGWRTIGRTPEGRPLLPKATRFRQGPPRPSVT